VAARSNVHVYVNSKAIERVKARLEERGRLVQPCRITVGIHEAEASQPKLDYDGKDSEASLGQVATAHEFGIGVQERSFLRTWFDQNRSRLGRDMNKTMREVQEGNAGAFTAQGEEWARELREWIETEEGGLTSLLPSTIEAKERAGLQQPDTPLYATGELVAAIKSMIDGS
jgi:hypothetical protein